MGKLTNKRSKPDLCIDATDCNIELQNKYGQVGYAILVRAVLDYTELLQLEYFNINIEEMKHSEFSRIKQKYDDAVQESIKSRIKEHGDAFDATEFKDTLLEGFKEQLVCVCCNEDVMCNVLVDVCYSTHTSKALLWDTCGDIIIRNLLAKNNNKLSFPKQSDEIEFTYKGLTFKMEVVEVETDSE